MELNADHGDRVKEGAVLARLHGAEQEARVTKANAGMINAGATVKKAEASVGKARAILVQKKQTNERKKELLAERTIPMEVADEAQMEEDVAGAEMAVAMRCCCRKGRYERRQGPVRV